jgi:hypothetical protein
VKSYIRNTINLSCAKILFPSVTIEIILEEDFSPAEEFVALLYEKMNELYVSKCNKYSIKKISLGILL